MTMIVGGLLAIGQPHGLRSGVEDPHTVLTLRRDKRTGWRRSSLDPRRSRREPRSPEWLWLETGTYASYAYRYLLTDALIWWAGHEALGLDAETVNQLRGYSQMEEVENDASAHQALTEARQQIEASSLSGRVSVFLALASGDQPAMVFPFPESDWVAELCENLRHLDIQYEIAAPIAARMTPGMGAQPIERTYEVNGSSLELFQADLFS